MRTAIVLLSLGILSGSALADTNCESGGCGQPDQVGLGRVTAGDANNMKVATKKSNPTGTVRAPGTGTNTDQTGTPAEPRHPAQANND